MAHVKPEVREGIVGPGVAFKAAFKGEAEIVATVICGDSYFNENLDEAKKVLVDDFNKTMITVAKDVKNKISFNPEIVDEYRLIGYENKGISKEDFENEEKDAGELGSGHQTLVTYEIILKDEYKNNLGSTDELFNLQINYKHPTSNVSQTFTHSSTLADLNNVVSEDHVFATCVVEFSLILRNSPYRGTASYEHLLARLSRLDCMTSDSLKAEFRDLVNLAFENKPPFNLSVAYQYTEHQSEFLCLILLSYVHIICFIFRTINYNQLVMIFF